MVEARLEVLITARNQLRGVLNQLDGQIRKIGTQVRNLNQQRTDRVTAQLAGLRTRAQQVGLSLKGLSDRFLVLNRARLDRLIIQMRGLRTATLGASNAARTLRTALGPFIGVFALVSGLISSIRLLAEFGQQMQVVGAISQATALEFELLENTARELGATTRFTAKQAAEGLEFLVRAGFSAQEATAALAGTLGLASAGLIDLAASASIVSSIVRQFGIDATEAGDVADILAQTAASSNVNVRQLGESFKFVGPIVASVGSTVEDTAFLLGILGNAGIQATVAGAGLRRAIGGIVNPTKEAASEINNLLAGTGGLINLQKTLRGPGGIIRAFELFADAGLDTGEAFNIFQQRGGLIAIALTRLLKTSGPLIERFNQLNGAAIRISTQIEDTLLGDFRKLLSATQELILGIGEAGATGALRAVTQGLVNFIRGIIGAEGATGGLAEAGRAVANAFRIYFALIRQIATFTGAVFSPIIDKLSGTFGALGDLLEGVVQQFKELGLITVDVTGDVERSFEQIRRNVEKGIFGEGEEPERRLKQFVDSQTTTLRKLGLDQARELRIVQEATIEAFSFATPAQRRLQNEIKAGAEGRIRLIEQERRRIEGIIKRSNALRLTLEKNRIAAELEARAAAALKDVGLTQGTVEQQIAFLDQRIALTKVRTKQEVEAFKTQLAEFEAVDKQRIAEGLPRLEGFFAQRAELQARGAAAEIEGATSVLALVRQREELRIDDLQARIEDLSRQISTATTEQAAGLRRERITLQTELDSALLKRESVLITSEGEVIKAQAARRAEDTKLTLEQTKLQEATQKFVDSAREELRDPIDIESFQVISARIIAENQKTLRNIEADTGDAAIAERFVDVRAVQELLSQVEAAFAASNAIRKQGLEELRIAAEVGDIGELERQERLIEVNTRAAEEQRLLLQPILDLQAAGIELTDAQIIQVSELTEGIRVLSETTLPILEDIREAFIQSFGQFLEDIVSGSKSAKEAFADFARDVISQIQKIIIQQLILNAVRGAFGGGGGGGGATVVQLAGSFKKGGRVKFAEGGQIQGPGGDTSDSVLIRASRDEYVMPAAITRKWLGVLEVMRSGKFGELLSGKSITLPKITIPKLGRFQGGGVVEPPQTTTAGGEQRSIRIINSLDPGLLNNFLSSSEGEQVLLNVLGRNPEQVKRILG